MHGLTDSFWASLTLFSPQREQDAKASLLALDEEKPEAGAPVWVGLGRIVALHYHSSTSYQIH